MDRPPPRSTLTDSLVPYPTLFRSATGNISIVNFTHDGTTVIGADGNDAFTGSAFADIFKTGGGDNIVNAGAGNDMIWLDDATAAGNQTVDAGAGDDVIHGLTTLTDADVINGGAGADTLTIGVAEAGYAGTGIAVNGNLTNVETIDRKSTRLNSNH